jgi:hypothetical protein
MMTPLRSRRLVRCLPLLFAILATGCGAKAAPPPASPAAVAMPSQGPVAEMAPAAAAARAPSTTPVTPGAPTPPPPPPAAPQKTADTRSAKNTGPSVRAAVIIYQGDMKMLADEEAIPKTIDKIIDVAESLGGNVSGRKDNSVQIKVPSASFRDAMTKIDALGAVTNRSVTADDVSEEFHDLEVRLANLKATRARLQEFLAKANGIGDMLTVERELERVAQEIDRMEGRLEFLRTRAAMSVISVAITAKPKPVQPVVATTTVTSAPAKERTPDLPIPWVRQVGIDTLLTLRK